MLDGQVVILCVEASRKICRLNSWQVAAAAHFHSHAVVRCQHVDVNFRIALFRAYLRNAALAVLFYPFFHALR
jgi:hypothetical protein